MCKTTAFGDSSLLKCPLLSLKTAQRRVLEIIIPLKCHISTYLGKLKRRGSAIFNLV